MQGVDFNSSELLDVSFINCNINLSNFRMSKLRRVKFESCTLEDSDFMSGKLKEVRFDKCVLDKANFTDVTIKDVDLSGSQIIGIIGVSSLKGVTIDSLQLVGIAAELALALGIKVKS